MSASRDWTEPRAKVEAEGMCRVCWAPDPDAAHIIPRSRVTPGIGEDPRNICPLCRQHHRAYDRQNGNEPQLDLLPYLTNEEQGYAVSLVGLFNALHRITGMHWSPMEGSQ